VTQRHRPSDIAIELLGLRLVGSLGTLNANGSVQLTPIWYLYDPRTQLLAIATGSTSQKVRNVLARPTATLLVDRREPVSHRWVAATGPAEVIGGAASSEINARVRQRYLTGIGEAAYGAWLASAVPGWQRRPHGAGR
jgi:PPOX class probable F420-dependent enzyme